MWSCDQSFVTVAFLSEKLSEPQFYKDLTRRVKIKSQKVLGAISYVCRSYRRKTGRGSLFAPRPHPE